MEIDGRPQVNTTMEMGGVSGEGLEGVLDRTDDAIQDRANKLLRGMEEDLAEDLAELGEMTAVDLVNIYDPWMKKQEEVLSGMGWPLPKSGKLVEVSTSNGEVCSGGHEGNPASHIYICFYANNKNKEIITALRRYFKEVQKIHKIKVDDGGEQIMIEKNRLKPIPDPIPEYMLMKAHMVKMERQRATLEAVKAAKEAKTEKAAKAAAEAAEREKAEADGKAAAAKAEAEAAEREKEAKAAAEAAEREEKAVAEAAEKKKAAAEAAFEKYQPLLKKNYYTNYLISHLHKKYINGDIIDDKKCKLIIYLMFLYEDNYGKRKSSWETWRKTDLYKILSDYLKHGYEKTFEEYQDILNGIEGFAREYIDPIKPRQEGPAVSQEEETPDGTPGGQSGVEEMSKPFDRFEKRRREETTSIRQKHLGEEGDFKVDTELNAMLTEIKGRLGIKEEDVIEKAQSEKIWKELKEAILRKNDEVLSTIENIPPPINKQIINNLWKPNIPDIPREANGSNRCWVNAPLYSILQNNIIRDKIRTNQSEFAKELLKFIGEEDGVGGVWNDTLYLDFIQKYEDNLFQPKPTAGKEETELQKQLDDKTILNKNRSKLSEIMDERSKRERERDEDIRSVLNGSFWDADYTIKFLVKEFKKLNINLSYHSVFPNPEGDQIPCAKSDANSMITGPTNGPIWKNCIKYDRDEKKPLNKLLSLVQSFKATIPSELKSSLDLKYGINYAKEQGVPPSAIDDILNGVKEGIDLGAHEIIKIIEDGGDISRIFNKSEILTIMSRIAHQVLREVGHFRSFIPIEVKKGEFSSEKFNDSYNWLRVDALKGFKPTDHPPIPSNEAYSFYIFLENEDEGESIKRGGGKRRVRTNKKRKGRRVNRTEKKNKRSRKKGNRRSRNERTPRERVQRRNEKTPKKRTLKKRR